MNLGQVDVPDVVGGVIVFDLASGPSHVGLSDTYLIYIHGWQKRCVCIPVKTLNLHGLTIFDRAGEGNWTLCVSLRLCFRSTCISRTIRVPSVLLHIRQMTDSVYGAQELQYVRMTYMKVGLVLGRLVKADLADCSNLTGHTGAAISQYNDKRLYMINSSILSSNGTGIQVLVSQGGRKLIKDNRIILTSAVATPHRWDGTQP